MNRNRTAASWLCALAVVTLGCGDDAASTNGAGTGASGFGAAGTGAAGTGSSAPNMPDATCMAAAGPSSPACSACACTPNAAGGCLTEVTACQAGADAMANQLCSAILACARTNNCTGQGCIGPCMSQIFAAVSYMGGVATTNASTVGMCTSTKCAAVCPTGTMPTGGTGASGTGASGTGASGVGASGTTGAGAGGMM